MTETPDDGAEMPGPDIGSVSEEAAKLLGALSDWAREHGEGAGAGLSGTLAGLVEVARDVETHVGGENCTYCPVCRVVAVVRATSPEVKGHLASAATSLLHAAAGVLATQVPPEGQRQGGPMHRIDLDGPWDPDLES